MSANSTERSNEVESEGVVSRWYEGKTIFITGGTGFMGKVIAEKMLSSCPGLKKIYVLIRSKKGEDVTRRLAKIKDSQVFQTIKKEYPERLNKLEALEGDIELPDLGLSAADTETMLAEVNVVFNLAATLQFNEDLRKSVLDNVIATKTLLDISTSMKNLQSFVHVSTAYSNSHRRDIEERIYPSPTDLDQLIKECEDCSDADIDELTTRVVGNRPNTYTLTKALAENVVEEYKTKFPVAIVRPSIVTAALNTPFPGWVDCKTGATGLLISVGSGLLRIINADRTTVLDMVPVDIVDDAIIVVAWKTACLGIRHPLVYNVTSGRYSAFNISELAKLIHESTLLFPLDNAVWYPSVMLTTNKFLYSIGSFWMHTVPAHIYDILVPTSFKKVNSLVKIQTMLGKVTDALEYFMTHSFNISDDNVRLLLAELTERDREMFNIDVKSIHWPTYCRTYMHGIRKHLLNQKDSDLPKAKKRIHKYSINHKVILLLTAGLAYFAAINVTTPYFVKAF